jgi:hypothetical protein
MRLGWLLALTLLVAPAVGVQASSDDTGSAQAVVGVPDTGINPYHEQFYQPDRTQDPCEYVDGLSCGWADAKMEKLNLSLDKVHAGELSVQEAVQQDGWDQLETEQWYWIPQTPFVAVYCNPPEDRGGFNSDGSATCILDDGTAHGSGTTSAVLEENPEALIAFKQGGPGVGPFENADVPVDVYSVSWGTAFPFPFTQGVPDRPFYVVSAGNDGRSTFTDGWAGNPETIAVGGGYRDSVTGDPGDEPTSGRDTDVVAHFCRELAAPLSADAETRYCGTSFSAPTVAGGLSKAIHDLRDESGYEGSITSDGLVDPVADVSKADLRDAVNVTATYDPGGFSTEAGTSTVSVPLADPAPWLQWGWGWYDGDQAPATVDHLTGDDTYEKSDEVRTYMETQHDLRRLLYG